MIKHLIMKNFIIIEELKLEFNSGLNVLTGETGVGKSIIMGALNLLMGEPLKSNVIYPNAEKAYLEVEFELSDAILPLMKKHEFNDDFLVFSKEINPNNSKTFLNGRRITNNIALEFREKLIDFHAQSDQLKLFNKNYQLELLDNFGNLSWAKENYFLEYSAALEINGKLNALKKKKEEKIKNNTLYTYQYEELNALNLKPDEENEINNELKILENSKEILDIIYQMEQEIFEGENALYDKLNFFNNKLGKINIKEISNIKENLESSMENLKTAVYSIKDLQAKIDLDPEKLEYLQQRALQISQIKTKYHKTFAELFSYIDFLENELSASEDDNQEILNLEKELKIRIEQLVNKANILSDKRKETAKIFAQNLIENMKMLSINDANFEVSFFDFNSVENYLPSGKNEIDFMFSANKGQALQNIKQAISGGELSRTILSIKKMLSTQEKNNMVYLFDEIDVGISGKTATNVGKFIKEISSNKQVICITHLPQVAVFADKHYLIAKDNTCHISKVNISVLSGEQRELEIARLLSGSQSAIALQHAKELLDK